LSGQPPSRPRSPRPGTLVFGAAVLCIAGAGGFLLHRLTAGHRTVYSDPAARLAPATAGVAEDGAPPSRRIPDRLPDIALPGPDGAMHRLTDWKGRPLLINFWATWCEPCRREIPLLKSLRRERAEEGFEVVGIAIDLAAEVRKYTTAHGMDYPVLVGEQGGLDAVGAFGMDTVLPFSVFVDRSGRIVTLKVGELHRDEADFILDRMRDVEAGRITLRVAQAQISEGIRRLNATRQSAGG
jgi:thiol-disulfide isomerase/thioredoxin